MTREEMIKIIIKMYNETAEALEKADKESVKFIVM